MTLGDFLSDLMARVNQGSSPDACVLCGTTTALLHPVGRAWACSRCHTSPARSAPTEAPGDVAAGPAPTGDQP